jgi:hypothetical protein
VAPVISRGAQDSLRAEFPKKVSELFQFVYFAEDDSPDENGLVWPGIGGSVYDRLALPESGTALIPQIVMERRRQHEAKLLQIN